MTIFLIFEIDTKFCLVLNIRVITSNRAEHKASGMSNILITFQTSSRHQTNATMPPTYFRLNEKQIYT